MTLRDGTSTAQRNARLVSIVRVLLACSLLSMASTLTGLGDPETEKVAAPVSATLAVLSIGYMLGLMAARDERWLLARSVVFLGWVWFPGVVPLLYTVDQPLLGQVVLLATGPLVMVVSQNAMLALAGWRDARGWIACSFLSYLIGMAAMAHLNDLDLQEVVTMAAIFGTLSAAGAWPARAVLADLETALADSETQRTQIETSHSAMRVARDEALAANSAKTRFLANMSHELRTPLNAIIGYTDLILEDDLDLTVQEVAPDVRAVRQAGAHLLGLINAILDLSRVEEGQVEVIREIVEPQRLIDEVIHTLHPLARQAGLTLQQRSTGLGKLWTDRLKVRQILINVLGNAIKYTPRGSVTVIATQNDRHLRIQIRDTGVGIAPEDVATVFEPFERTTADITRSVGGTGLGLAVTQRLCRMLDGTIELESTLGEGSRFTITLPIPDISEEESTARTAA